MDFNQDPAKLTISELKSILTKNGVSLPVLNVKKAEYIELFNKKKQEKN